MDTTKPEVDKTVDETRERMINLIAGNIGRMKAGRRVRCSRCSNIAAEKAGDLAYYYVTGSWAGNIKTAYLCTECATALIDGVISRWHLLSALSLADFTSTTGIMTAYGQDYLVQSATGYDLSDCN